MQRGPRERESRYLQFTFQRPGDLIYIPHLLAHAVLTLDTGSPTILSRWDAATTTNHQIIIQTLNEYTFGVRCGKWREFFREKGLVALRKWVFSPATGPQESESKLVKHWQYWEKYSPGLLNMLSIEGPVTSKKVKRRPPIQTKDFRSALSFYSAHIGYYHCYYFSLYPPSVYQRKQISILKRLILNSD